MFFTHAEIATRALAILDRDGWNKGYLVLAPIFSSGTEYKAGSHCIGGAINLAASPSASSLDYGWHATPQMTGFYEHVVATIRRLHPEFAPREETMNNPIWLNPIWFIASWNNDPATTYADVRAVLTAISAEVPVAV